jgi:hypothetical protein
MDSYQFTWNSAAAVSGQANEVGLANESDWVQDRHRRVLQTIRGMFLGQEGATKYPGLVLHPRQSSPF